MDRSQPSVHSNVSFRVQKVSVNTVSANIKHLGASCLGISTLLLRVPVTLGVAHQGGAALLLVALLLAWHADGLPDPARGALSEIAIPPSHWIFAAAEVR